MNSQKKYPFAWRTPLAAAALAVFMGVAAPEAYALALGKVTVLSAIGEPLRAEVDVPEINADEAASLRSVVANPDAFKAAGMEYNSALKDAQITLQRRANGSAFLSITSQRVINDPFVDLILESSWGSGRIVRDYTMLFDPPSLRSPAAAAVNSAAVSAAPAPTRPASVAPAAAVVAEPTPARASTAPAKTVRERPAKPSAAPKDAAAKPSPKDGVLTKAGDTAAAIAARYKPAGVSLDQMLVSMLRSNPDAFVDGNVNRLRKGAVLDVQGAGAGASGTSVGEAKQTITAQAKDFDEFRRRLASGAPLAAASGAGRAASGKVQSSVSEAKSQASAPDKLTLSKGAIAAKSGGKEEALAKDKQSKDSANRVAELNKNIQELNKLNPPTTAKPGATIPSAATTTPSSVASTSTIGGAKVAAAAVGAAAVGAAAIASAASKPVATSATSTVSTATKVTPTTTVSSVTAVSSTVTKATATTPSLSTPTVTVAASSATTATASTPKVTSTSTVTASGSSSTTPTATVAAAPKPVPVAPPPPPPEPSFLESLTENPALIPGAGVLLAGLGGLAFWRIRQRKKNNAQVDSSFLESRLQPDSFFGASGGQRVDTADSAAGQAGSSMVYSPSQLDAAGDVDPVAEADVYLAYGRDLQAEEILKEAMRLNPSRVAIHAKLLEIYAKRRDSKAFEVVAKEAFSLTQGHGPEWDAASALGRELDPTNTLYTQGNAAPVAGVSLGGAAAGLAVGAAAAVAATSFDAISTIPHQVEPAAVSSNTDFDVDLDLDFSADPAPASAHALTQPVQPVNTEQTAAFNMQQQASADMDYDFDLSMPAGLATTGSSSNSVKLSATDMASFSNDLSFEQKAQPIQSAPTAPMAMNTSPGSASSLEFDLGGLSLDLPSVGGSAALAASDAVDAGISGDPLETKLALAMEFRDIGDMDGARSLVREVVDEASGALKSRASKMLADLG